MSKAPKAVAVPRSLYTRRSGQQSSDFIVTPNGHKVASAVAARIDLLRAQRMLNVKAFLDEIAGMAELVGEAPKQKVPVILTPKTVVPALTPISIKLSAPFIREFEEFLDTGDIEKVAFGQSTLSPALLKATADYIFVQVKSVDNSTGEVQCTFISSGKDLIGYLADGLELKPGLAVIHRTKRDLTIHSARNLTDKQKRLALVFNNLYGSSK